MGCTEFSGGTVHGPENFQGCGKATFPGLRYLDPRLFRIMWATIPDRNRGCNRRLARAQGQGAENLVSAV